MTDGLTGWFKRATAVVIVVAVSGCGSKNPVRREAATPLAGAPGGTSTSRAALDDTVARMRARLAKTPGDANAAVLLADALLRQTRVIGNAGLAIEAERVLHRALTLDPDHYQARRMLAAVYASQHRFRDALAEADRCLAVRTDDAWVYGVIGDARVELGEYSEAFDAFDRMVARRPNAASYARASYARELQGDLRGALQAMQMAAEATGAQDPESLAWHHAQLGHLYLELGQLTDARREFEHADYVFPDHPFAVEGLARMAAAEGDNARALTILTRLLSETPAPATLALAGDLLAALGRTDEAERQYRLAEAAWQSDVPDPPRLARFLAEHGRRLDEAIRLAESTDRQDIFTADALAWAYFQTGRLTEAQAKIKIALSTGSRDRAIREHAAAIARAAGKPSR
jgi:tetratricopeptide (TPR) repeat protein